METTAVFECVCPHKAQDEIYGRGKRLHNLAVKKNAYYCTVCGRQHISASAPKKEEKKKEDQSKGG